MTGSSVTSRCALAILFVFMTSCAQEDAAPSPPEAATVDSGAMAPDSEDPPFNYPGGWLTDGGCVDICGVTPESPVDRPPAVVCFNPDDPECAAKTGDGDYDYLMLSQHWLPTMCLGLAAGYDTTVTHKGDARCTAETPSRLTLHGLWPNYTAGFPQCCATGVPLDVDAMASWPEELKSRLWRDQPDPTVGGFEPAMCEIFNHEWQKHGTCFIDSGDVDADARAYFELGLELFDRLAGANAQIDAWAGERKTRAEIEALYPHAVQILCDVQEPHRLLEVHTCWSRESEGVDCAPTKGFGSLIACAEEVELPTWQGASAER